MKGLEGIKVIELTSFVAAPACPRILGEMGAEIIKVEPFKGDDQRTQGPGYGCEHNEKEDPAFDFASINKNWLSINLKDPKGYEFLMKLIGDADILVTSFRDKALVKLGLDYETLSKKFPKLIFGHMRGYGERGPEKDSKGFDATAYSARGGLLTAFPQKGETPVNVPAAFGDFNAAGFLTAGVLAALVRRERTGKGDKVVVNLYHVACWAMQIALVSRQWGAEYPRSRKSVPFPSNNTYCSKDGVWFLMCVAQYDTEFEKMMKALGMDHLSGDPTVNTLEAVRKNQKFQYMVEEFEKAFAGKTFAEWEPILRENELPFQKCFTLDDILEDEEAFANDILRTMHYESYGDRLLPTSPIRLGSVGDPDMRKSKPIGYHTRDYMLQCGYTEEEVSQMEADGVVKCYHGGVVAD